MIDRIEWQRKGGAMIAEFREHQLYVRRIAPRVRQFVAKIDGESVGGHSTELGAQCLAAKEAKRRFGG